MAKQKTTQKEATKKKVAVKSTAPKTVVRDAFVRNEIIGLVERTEQEFLDLAELLHEAYHADYAKKWGYEDFKSWASAEVKCGLRKAFYFVDIWGSLKKLGSSLPREEIAALGWTKVKEIAHILTTENAEEWLERAKKLSSRELQEQVKIQRQRSGDLKDRPTLYTINIRLSEEQNSAFLSAMKRAKDCLGETSSDPQALEHIATDWLQAQGVMPEFSTLDNVIKWVESCYNVSIKWEPVGHVAETQEANEAMDVVKEKAGNGNVVDEDMDLGAAPEKRKNIADLLGL